MNDIFRKVIGIVFAIAFALPSIAAGPTKNFSVNISPQYPVGANFDLTAAFANTSPPQSNSTINSGILILPASSGVTINSIVPSTGSITLFPNVSLPYSGAGALEIKFSGITGVRPPDPPFTLTINVSVAVNSGCRAITWSAQAFAGNSFSGDKFNFVDGSSSMTTALECQWTGIADCGDPIQTSSDPAGQGDMRGLYNKDGTCNSEVNYIFTKNPADRSSALKWDIEPGAAFSYTVFGTPVDVDSTGWPPATVRPHVGWEFNAGSLVPLYKAFAVACMGNSLPAPYGNLAAALGGLTTDTTATVTTTATLPATPFPIQIGNERLNVTSKSGSSGTVTLTVVRGDAGTPVSGHALDAIVMSNPLPIDPNPLLPNGDPNPYLGRQDQMCIAAQGWTVFGINPATGKQQVRRWLYVFDIGDGWIIPNE